MCTCVCICARICKSVCVCACACAYVYEFVYVYVCACVCMRLCVCLCMCVFPCVCKHTRTSPAADGFAVSSEFLVDVWRLPGVHGGDVCMYVCMYAHAKYICVCVRGQTEGSTEYAVGWIDGFM